jgi:hypothetical protein
LRLRALRGCQLGLTEAVVADQPTSALSTISCASATRLSRWA